MTAPELGPAIIGILGRVEVAVALQDGLTCCAACGCLCRESEHCPNCHPERWENPL